jgi:8-oxo-dGTP diphosphatase
MTLAQHKQKFASSLKERSLVFVFSNQSEVLLGQKKDGLGKGKWVGIGGKQEEGETIEQTAKREFQEEVGAKLLDIEKVGTLDFYFPNGSSFQKWNQRVQVFISRKWEGDIIETPEIFPQWFDYDKVPWENMWDDYAIWFKLVLEQKQFSGDFLYDENMKVVEFRI